MLTLAVVFAAYSLSFKAASANGDPDTAKLPQIVASMQPGEWRPIPNTKMKDVFPPSGGHPAWGVSGPRDVIGAWGGGALDTKRNAMVFNGGGHEGYGGNEVYAFWLATLKWERLTDPSPIMRDDAVRADGSKLERWKVIGDVAPISTHTYGSLIYIPSVDRVMRSGGADYRIGWSLDPRIWLFDPQTRAWQFIPGSQLGGIRYAQYDPVTGLVISIGVGSLNTYNPVTQDIKKHPLERMSNGLVMTGVLDPHNRVFLDSTYNAKGHGLPLLIYRIEATGRLQGPYKQPTTGATEFDHPRGFTYDSKRKRVVGYIHGADVGYLDTDTWVWERFKNETSPYQPVKPSGIGYDASADSPSYPPLYGRWRYVEKCDCHILIDNPFRDVLVWKPMPVAAGDTTPLPSPQITTILQSLRDGQTVTLPPGVYSEAAVISASNVVIKAQGVHLRGASTGGKGALVVTGNNVTIEGMEISQIRVSAENGACVRLEGRDLTLRGVHFHDSENGVLSWNRDSGTILIERSRFERLGYKGQAHAIYIGRGNTHLIVRDSHILRSRSEGHEIKSRASKNTIERNIIASLDGVDSRLIDLPDGGENIIRRNVLEKGPSSANQDLIGVGLEGQNFLHPRSSTVIEDNTIILERKGPNVLLHQRHVPPARVVRNKVIGGPRPGGDNRWFPDRATAGLGAYPTLPLTHW